jgi:anti-sigma B factor antagonist
MEITTREENGIAVLNLSGRLDLSSGSMLKEEIKKSLDKNVTSIHLNLSQVEFINSSGLGSLVSIMKEIRLLKGRFTLSDLASYVREIFEITQLSHIFEIFASEDEALSSYQSVVANQ